MANDMKTISILGATGSIGRSSLDVISSLGDSFNIFGLSCHKNIVLLYEQIIQFNPIHTVFKKDHRFVINAKFFD